MKFKKAISLIVLIITIVIMIILAGSVILTLGNSGIISKTKIGIFKNDASNYKSELQVALANALITDGSFDPSKISKDGIHMRDYIKSMKEEDLTKFRIISGRLVYTDEEGILTIEEQESLKEVGIRPKTEKYVTKAAGGFSSYTGGPIYLNPVISVAPEIQSKDILFTFDVNQLCIGYYFLDIKASTDSTEWYEYAWKDRSTVSSDEERITTLNGVVIEMNSEVTLEEGWYAYNKKIINNIEYINVRSILVNDLPVISNKTALSLNDDDKIVLENHASPIPYEIIP